MGGTLVHTKMEWGLCRTLNQGQLPSQQEPEDMLKPTAEQSWAETNEGMVGKILRWSLEFLPTGIHALYHPFPLSKSVSMVG